MARTAHIVALLLLAGLIAPPMASPGPARVPRALSATRGTVWDNSGILPRDVRESGSLSGLPGLTHVFRVAPGIFRGAQPKHEGYATLKEMGIRTVISLRKRHKEKEAVEAAGMRFVGIPMSFLKKADPADVRKALSVMTDPANQPVYIHCSVGLDRTGVVVAVYRMEVDGWSRAEAVAEMEALGFNNIWFRLKKTATEWKR